MTSQRTQWSERGSVTLWMVGMMLVVLVVGGLAVDLWRSLSAHRYVAAVADAAAVAAGSGVDEAVWRSDGRLALDASRVAERVAQSVGAHDGESDLTYDLVVAADGSQAVVSVAASVELTLLRLVTDGAVDVSATATAAPVVSP